MMFIEKACLLLTGMKYLEYISRIRNTKMISSNNNESNETMSQNMQSLKEQNVDNVQYRISRDRPKIQLMRN
jgi:hypothetical protein